MLYLKYKSKLAIFLIITLFLLCLGVLVSSIKLSLDTKNYQHAIRLIDRQSFSHDRMLVELYRIKQMTENDESPLFVIDQLMVTYTGFNEILDAFIYGGELIGQGMDQDNFLHDPAYAESQGLDFFPLEALYRDYRHKTGLVAYLSWRENVGKQEIIKKVDSALASGIDINVEINYRLQDAAELMEEKFKETNHRLHVSMQLAVAVVFSFAATVVFTPLVVSRNPEIKAG